MHAAAVLQKCFADVFSGMHAARVQVLGQAVLALLSCRRLVLMDLARAWPQAERVRGPLKALDRLLSNPHLQCERLRVYAQIARWTVRCPEPLIVVDWSTLKANESWHLLRAALAVGGRTLTLYEEVHPQRAAQSPRVHRAFLKRLHGLLPAGSRPIILTDAGFRCPWFAEVEALGWRWIGRVRNAVCVRGAENSAWQALSHWLQGPAKLRAFGAVQLVRARPFACQLLRYRQCLRGRKHRTVRGQVCLSKASRAAARGQREPWLLVYCNALAHAEPMRIVNLYAKRMQIELSFRDLKSERYGCAFRHSLTRKGPRIAILLLLHAMACFLAWLQGSALCQRSQTGHCAAQPRASHAQYSVVRIGWESLRRRHPPSPLLLRLTPRSKAAWFTAALGLNS